MLTFYRKTYCFKELMNLKHKVLVVVRSSRGQAAAATHPPLLVGTVTAEWRRTGDGTSEFAAACARGTIFWVSSSRLYWRR